MVINNSIEAFKAEYGNVATQNALIQMSNKILHKPFLLFQFNIKAWKAQNRF